MTNNSSKSRRLDTLTGLVGEHLAAERLRALGWYVDDDVFGGQRHHYDLRAVSSTGRVTQVSVKTSTQAAGGLA